MYIRSCTNVLKGYKDLFMRFLQDFICVKFLRKRVWFNKGLQNVRFKELFTYCTILSFVLDCHKSDSKNLPYRTRRFLLKAIDT